jgi:hypothetical protein
MMREQGHRWAGRIGAVVALALLSGCSTYDSMFGSKPTATSAPTPSSSSPSFTQRFSNMVTGGPAIASGQSVGGSPADLDCPTVEIRQGAATYSVSAPDNGSTALSLRYQANFVRSARECALRNGNVTMKVGIEGRIIIGPAGATGTAMLPVRLALVREGVEPNTIWTKFYMVPVDLPPGQSNVVFSHVEEDMTFPMVAKDFDAYVVYVGFDPDSAAAEKRRPAPKAKPKR